MADRTSSDDFPILRRVVTGHDAGGKSVVMIDAPCVMHGDIAGGQWAVQDIWESPSVPAQIPALENDPSAGPLNFNLPDFGVKVRISDLPPAKPGSEPFMHRTNSIDYLHVLEGEVCMQLDDSEHEIVLRKGDTIVQRATNHAWINRSDRHCRLFIVMVAGRITPELETVIGPMPDWDPEHRR